MVDDPRYRPRDRSDDGERDGWFDSRVEARGSRRPEPRLEQRLDQWMTAGRQLVDGVAGARPGSRPSARGAAAGAGPRLRPGDLGRWVEQKIDWLLEDDDGWQEPWQGQGPPARAPLPPASPPVPGPRRRPLEAISRRGAPLLPERRVANAAPDPQEWPDDESFSLNRWSRPGGQPQPRPVADPVDQARPLGRTVPRSSRRRWD